MAPAVDTPQDEKRGTTLRPRPKRGEGQWALGYREPLNANEQSKKDDNPLNVRARIENIYSVRGFESIDPGDMRGRFRWWGLYTQRKAGIDGGKTATLEPEELEDKFFMLRVRIDGGRLNLAQLRTDVDDAALPLVQQRQKGLRRGDRAEHVDVELPPHSLHRHALQRASLGGPRVVDQAVQPLVRA